MNEQQVERVAEAMFLSENPLAASGDWDGQQRAVYEGLARVALDALGDVEPEPTLEDVLRDAGMVVTNIEVEHDGVYAEVNRYLFDDDRHITAHARGKDINAAIRSAVANATKGGDA